MVRGYNPPKTNSGKTVAAEQLMSILFRKKYKIVSIYNSWRWESAFMAFPCNMNKWQLKIREKYGLSCYGLPIKIHIPLSKDLKYIPRGISEPFTIPLYEMDEQEISFIGSSNPSQIQITLMGMALEKMKPESTMVDFILEVRKLVRQKTIYIKKIDFPSFFQKSTLKVILRMISTYLRESIVSSKNCPTAIDLEEILNDNSYISVFAEGLLPPNLRYLTVSYLVRKIFDLCKEGKVHVPIFLFTDESEDIIPQDTNNELIMKTRDVYAEMARGARGANISLGIVTQSPLSLYDKVRRQLQTKFVFWMDSPEELSFLKDSHRSLTKEELERISNFTIGECMIFEMGKPAEYMQSIPPPFLHREPEFSFFDIYKKYYNGEGSPFEPAEPFLKFVEDEIESKMNEYGEYREAEMKEEKKKKKKEFVKSVKDYDIIKEIIQHYYSIRRMNFTSFDVQQSNPKINLRNIQRILSRLVKEKTLKDMRGKPKEYEIISL